MKQIFLVLALIFLVSCNGGGQYQHFTIPKIEECRFLTNSIFCTDKRLNDKGVDKLIQYVESSRAIPEDQKLDLVDYFETNRAQIIKVKEFEIGLEYKGFFRGYLLVPVQDEKELKNFMDNKLRELDRYIDTYGPLKQKTKSIQREFPR